MKKNGKKEERQVSIEAWIMLVLGAATYTFSSGRLNIFFTAWIWPFAFLYFCREVKGKCALPTLAATIAICSLIKWYKILDISIILDIVLALVLAAFTFVPFVAERILGKRIRGAWATLLFPATTVTCEILFSTILGSFNCTANTQSGILTLVQITSVIGSFGLSFIILWFGSVLLAMVKRDKGWRTAVTVYAILFVGVICFGIIRLEFFRAPHEKTVRVASAVCPYVKPFSDGSYDKLPYEDTRDYMIRSINLAHDGGAQVLCWNEEAFTIFDYEEAELRGLAKEKAAEYGMYMVMSFDIEDTDDSFGGKGANKLVIVTPEGEEIEYHKVNLVPLIETFTYVRGTEDIPTWDMDGTIASAVICFDDTYPWFMNGSLARTSAAYPDTSLMFVPSWDWVGVKRAHYVISELRAIENGFTLVKPTYDGISTVVDYQGHAIARFDTLATGFDSMQILDVPVAGVRTIYSRYGFVLDMLILALCLGLVGLSAFKRKK